MLAWLKALVRTLDRWADWLVDAALGHEDPALGEPPIDCVGKLSFFGIALALVVLLLGGKECIYRSSPTSPAATTLARASTRDISARPRTARPRRRTATLPSP